MVERKSFRLARSSHRKPCMERRTVGGSRSLVFFHWISFPIGIRPLCYSTLEVHLAIAFASVRGLAPLAVVHLLSRSCKFAVEIHSEKLANSPAQIQEKNKCLLHCLFSWFGVCFVFFFLQRTNMKQVLKNVIATVVGMQNGVPGSSSIYCLYIFIFSHHKIPQPC